MFATCMRLALTVAQHSTSPRLGILNTIRSHHAIPFGGAMAATNFEPIANQSGPMSLTVAAVNADPRIKDRADYVCDGDDDHVEIQAALDSIGLGATVTLSQGTFDLGAAILLDNRQTLQGQGEETVLIPSTPGDVSWAAQDGEPIGALIELARQDVSAAKISRLRIEGRRSNYTLRGIYLNTTSNPISEPDAEHKLEHLVIQFCGSNPVYITGVANRAGRTFDCRFTTNNAEWRQDGADWEHTQVDVSGTGILCDGANNRWVNCKSFFAGGLPGGANGLVPGHGFNIVSSRQTFAGCEAQDCFGNGFHIDAADTTISGCLADSNGFNGTGTPTAGGQGNGFHISANRVIIAGCSSIEKQEDARGQHQGWGYFVESGHNTLTIIGHANGNQLGGFGGDTADAPDRNFQVIGDGATV